MDRIITIVKKYLFFFLLLVLPVKSVLGQSVGSINLQFGASACAGLPDPLFPSTQFNWFRVNFTISPTGFTGTPTFEVVLYDITDTAFTNPILGIAPSQLEVGSVASTNGQNYLSLNATDKLIRFGLPTDLPGSTYRLRVRQVGVPSVSLTSPSGGFSAAYQSFNLGFTINNDAPSLAICGIGSATLFVDAATPGNPSPLAFPKLKYKWFNGTTIITGQTTSTLTVNSSGTYHVEIDYGLCTNNTSLTRSKDIVVSVLAGGQTFTITPSFTGPVCPASPVTLSTTPGYTYQWSLNGNIIAGATNFQYTTAIPGTYKVSVTGTNCSAESTNSITVDAEDFNASLNVPLAPAKSIIVAGETKNIVVSTDASSPTFKWYKENVLLASETSSSYDATAAGNYKVEITQTVGCVFTKELLFILREGINVTQIPNVISPNNDGINDTWTLPQALLNNQNTEVKIVNSFGDVVLNSSNYQNDWPETTFDFKSVNPVFYYTISKDGDLVNQGSITVVK
jgi:gliding motility-associated-like protein